MLRRAQAMRTTLRARQPLCESGGRLPEETNQDFLQAGFYRILQPRCFGGYEFDMPTFVEVMAEVARGCVESGWALALTAGHPAAFLSSLPVRGQHEVYGSLGDVRVPAVAKPGGFAVQVEGGYRFKAAWDYSSGIDVATHFLGGLMVVDPGSGQPLAYGYALLHPPEYQIIDNWNVWAMRGTGSKRVVVEEMFLPEHRFVALADGQLQPLENIPGRTIHKNPLYYGNYLPLLFMELASVAVGAAKGALDIYEGLLRNKKHPLVPPFVPVCEIPEMQRHFGDAQAWTDSSELALRSIAEWYQESCRAQYEDGVELSLEVARRMLRAEQEVVRLAWDAVELMFRTGGSSSAAQSALLGRYFRNLAVIRTHITMQSEITAANVARLHYGLPAFGSL
jgi:3-hydroxy-9,10-secoandrosta-1,3,5(10)-triene-9,17-dione monooxygenase